MDTKRIEIEDTALINALIAVDTARSISADDYPAARQKREFETLRALAEEVRRHVSGPASCSTVRAAEAERRRVIEAEVRQRIGNIHSELKNFEAEFYRLNAVCDNRTEGN